VKSSRAVQGAQVVARAQSAQRLAALRFFYIQNSQKTWSIAETPYPKKAFRLPSILAGKKSRDSSTSSDSLSSHSVVTLYATGVPTRLN